MLNSTAFLVSVSLHNSNSAANINMLLTSAQLPLECRKNLTNCLLLLYSDPSAILLLMDITARLI